MSSQYIFDKDGIKFQKKRTSVWAVVRRILMFFVATASMAVLYYVVFALIFSTGEERRLRDENRIYEREFPTLEQKEKLLADVVDGLKIKDNSIYDEVFHAPSPDIDPMTNLDFFAGVDSIADSDIVIYAEKKISQTEARARSVEDNFTRIMEVIMDKDFEMPPMANPLDNFSFAQTGASVGDKVNPFYKVPMRHNGLDMLASTGEPVYAPAAGTVSRVTRSGKGLGNVVEIGHGNGYITRYGHLSDISVAKGRRLKKGARIGYVGVSGNSFAPHLHYEVVKDTLTMDPVNYMFASLTPEEYMNILVMSVVTGQSMD